MYDNIWWFDFDMVISPWWNTDEVGTFSDMKFPVHMWNGNISTHEMPNSYVKWVDSKFHMWNLGVQNMYFTYEMEDLRTKHHFAYEIPISHMEFKQLI